MAVITVTKENFEAEVLNSDKTVLLDGATGQVLDMVALHQTIEASPVVFGNRIIMGTRLGIVLFFVR